MKNSLLAVVMLAAVTMMTGCSASPNVGFEAVLVEKPVIFGHGGVDPEPVRTGLTFIAPSTDAIYVSMQPIQAHEEFDDLMSSDGVPLKFDAVILVQITDSVDLIKRFGEAWYTNNIERQFMNFTRQAVRKYDSNETAIKTTAIDAIDAEITANLIKYLADTKIPVKLIKVTVGKASPPDAIKHQRIETAQQEQRILTEQQRKLAEDSRKAAELSRAEADNAYKNAMSLSPDQYLTLENIKMIREVCVSGAKCTFISNGGKAQPILDAR